MIVSLLKQINEKLGVIIEILRKPEDFSGEDKSVKDTTKAVSEAKDRIPH